MLSEEEKKIKNVQEMFEGINIKNIDEQSITIYGTAILDVMEVLNLIENQQKEIEELKKPKYIMNFISKDRIKAKIEQFKVIRNTILDNEEKYERPMMTYDLIRNDYCEKMLQELLEEDKE